MSYTNFDDFYSSFNIPDKKLEYSEYKSKLKILDSYNQSYEDAKLFVKWAEQSDYWTDQSIDDFCKRCYELFVLNPKRFLKEWYERHIQIKSVNKVTEIIDCEKNDVIDGTKKVQYGRVIKNMFYEDIYSTFTSNSKNGPTTFEVLKKSVEQPFIFYAWKTPSSERFVSKDPDKLSTLFAILRGTSCKASVFNPNTVGYIIKNILKSKKLFTPCLGWGSYLVGSYPTKVNHYVGVDVIQSVVDKCNELCVEHIKKPSMKFFEENDYKFDFYCCPSEQLDKRHNFSEKYKEYFDSVFFSPPYFDLEVYQGGEQSIESFPTYKEWLRGYWEETVKICYNVLEKGGMFSFVIVPQYERNSKDKNKKETIYIGDDLSDISKKYFTYEGTKQIKWMTQKSLHVAKQKDSGNSERLYIFKK